MWLFSANKFTSENSDDDLNRKSMDSEEEKEEEEKENMGIEKKRRAYKTLEELIQPMSSKYNLNDEIKKLEYITCCIGACSPRIKRWIRLSGIGLWVLSLLYHFASDIYESIVFYGYTFLAVQAVWFSAFILLTWATAFRTLPWLEEGLRNMRRNECYEKSITEMVVVLKKIPYIALVFGIISSAIQHGVMAKDGGLHVDYGLNATAPIQALFHTVRFVTGVHIYFAYMLFWVLPTAIMLMTGYAMTEFMDQMSVKMKDKTHVLTFKEAISTYSSQAQFVKQSSSKCLVVLTTLLFTAVICFGLNAYLFLFIQRRYIHLWHSLLPAAVMIYPLCQAAWVTKKYRWFIIVVVRAWVHRDDLDETSSEEDSGIDEVEKSPKKTSSNLPTLPKFSKKRKRDQEHKEISKLKKNKKTQGVGRVHSAARGRLKRSSSLGATTDQLASILKKKHSLFPWQRDLENLNAESNEKTQNSFAGTVGAAKAIAKFRKNAKQPRFNFEKFLSYLESMRSVVGFEIAGIIVTWDLVSTSLFLMFSIIAVFMQESIFGSQKSTL
ncbi:uncharacterized protein LOC130636715 isoform X2 [Hydractinia symbiolongicarpus]|uniref:uncharacterized protein LOC130636715 isoform X2 n=1 Tax=Hydractinia symbiolongicarpus TaxID=13093 RepID=UPI00254A066A|nr:uncharacterized protein LOC130636715 isoform X2 [Hydractinia symbiolongicarpus]